MMIEEMTEDIGMMIIITDLKMIGIDIDVPTFEIVRTIAEAEISDLGETIIEITEIMEIEIGIEIGEYCFIDTSLWTFSRGLLCYLVKSTALYI